VSLTWAVAQRANVDLNIEASIAIGGRSYWRGLASSIHFWGKTLKECLEAIHDNIVTVWNFLDPKLYLARESFKAKMAGSVEDLKDNSAPNPNTALSYGSAAMSAVSGVVGGLSGPAAPVVIPIVVTAVLAKWLYDVYQQTPGIIRVLMGYIVDLTAVLECLFSLIQSQGGTGPRAVTLKLIDLTLEAYSDSEKKAQCHHKIKTFVENTNIFQPGHRDSVFEEVAELIRTHRFELSPELRREAKALGADN